MSIIEHGLSVAAVLVVAQDGIPRNHQLGVVVDEFEVGEPQRVVDRCHAFEVVYIAQGEHGFGAVLLGHGAHQRGDLLLLIVTIAAEVVGDVE